MVHCKKNPHSDDLKIISTIDVWKRNGVFAASGTSMPESHWTILWLEGDADQCAQFIS